MADDEQFSLCWNNFNSNLSAGFHESLCRGDLVDVTLAAEGQFVKAHRLVLSVCSPYFRKMFTQMPANQHAFVFLKDVSHTALKDLIQFMYCGEVNVKQEALPAFISTAEALQIKGLTDSDPPAQSPAEPPAPIPQQLPSPRMRQRTQTQRSTYKIDTLEDNGDKMQQPTQIVIQTTAPPQATLTQQTQHLQTLNQQQQHVTPIVSTGTTTTAVVTHKRPAQRNTIGGSAPHIKRTKNTIDPLEMSELSGGNGNTAGTQQITVQTAVVTASVDQKPQQQSSDTEYIDLPMEISTKAEPEYSEEGGDVDGGDNDGTAYVEDDSYGEVRYDDNYFTENEDGPTTANVAVSSGAATGGITTATTSKTIVKQQPASFSDSYTEAGDQNNSDAQGNQEINFTYNYRGQLVYQNHAYSMYSRNGQTFVVQWRCSSYRKQGCRAFLTTKGKELIHMREPFKGSGYPVLLNPYLCVKPSIAKKNVVPISRRLSISTKKNTIKKSSLTPNHSSSRTSGTLVSKLDLPDGSIVKTSADNHNLTVIRKSRLFGRCVNCLKTSENIKNLPKIVTHCRECKGGPWMCESCFDVIHEQ